MGSQQRARPWFPGRVDRKKSQWQMVLAPDPWGLPLAAERSVTGLGAKLEGVSLAGPNLFSGPGGRGRARGA